MKIVKYVFLLLLLASIALTVFIATQEGKYNIKKEKVINVSRPVLYNYLNDYKNWENLGLFASTDTLATFTYSDNTVGRGAYMSWVKESNSGKIQTKAVAANDSIIQKATIDNLDADVAWVLKDTLKSTKVSVRLTGKLTFTQKAYALLNGGIGTTIDSSLERGLVNLNNFLVKELQVYSTEVIGLINKKGVFYLGTTVTLPLADVHKKAQPAFDKLLTFARENNITLSGKPFIIYKNINNEKKTAKCTYSIPIKDEMFTTPGSDYEGGKLLPFNAVKTTLRGDYSHLPKAWAAGRKHIEQKALQEKTTAQYLEIYTKNSTQTRRPSMWITNVYIPTGAPEIIITEKDTLLPAATPRAIAPAAGTGTKPATANPAAPKPGTSTTRPAATGTSTVKPAAATTKPAAATVKPASGNTTKPAGTTTTKPAATTPKPATTTQPKPAGNSANKPATTTAVKPAATTPAKPKPAKTTTKPKQGTDDLNPPRA
jgi:predicted transcriptional regulator YdeE